jgi:hypothetical protein
MIVAKGNVAVGGTIAYVPQSPWVQNLSLRDNILFGMPYDEEKYKAVIHACALELDLKILPNGAHNHRVAVLYFGGTLAQEAVVKRSILLAAVIKRKTEQLPTLTGC